MMVPVKQAKCDCCKEIRDCVVLSASSDEKGEPRIVCEKCNHIKETKDV